MFVTQREDFLSQMIINFPTKAHWKYPSQIKWVQDGLADLRSRDQERRYVRSQSLRSEAAMGPENGWKFVPDEKALAPLVDVNVVVYEPTAAYQNVANERRGGITDASALTPRCTTLRDTWNRNAPLGSAEVRLFPGTQLQRFNIDNKFKIRVPEPTSLAPYSEKLKHC